jgi:L-lactate dehydrogenase complex protein LldF
MSTGELIWTDDPPFPENARRAVEDSQLRGNLRKATTTIRERRARMVADTPDWQELRAAGAAIKNDVLANLDRYLEQFEAAAAAPGAHVHWARDAAEACEIVRRLVAATGERQVIKVKSMATQEIGLVDALERVGIKAYETDLAELIVQLGRDRPSHIVVPAIHKNRAEIREMTIQTGINEPRYVTLRAMKQVQDAEVELVEPDQLGSAAYHIERMLLPDRKRAASLGADAAEMARRILELVKEARR